MKKIGIFLLAMTVNCLIAAELDIDGKFNDFARNWRTSSRKIGTVELVSVDGVNYVQLSAENNPRGKIGILTAGKGFPAQAGSKFTISVDVKGGPLEIAVSEYGNKKYLGSSRENCNATKKTAVQKASFTVKDKDTDSIRFAFNVKKGATAVLSNIKVDMIAAPGEKVE